MLTSLTDGEEADPSRHIVLDFSNIDIIYSFEIGILVTTVKKLSGTGRTLFIIINSKIKKVIESTNIERLKNLCMLSENQWNKKRHEIEPVPDIH